MYNRCMRKIKSAESIISKEYLNQLYIVEGKSRKEICSLLNICDSKLSDIIKYYNLEKPNKYNSVKWLKENIDREEFVNYYNNHNIRETAIYYNTSVNYITQYCKEINFIKNNETIIKQKKRTRSIYEENRIQSYIDKLPKELFYKLSIEENKSHKEISQIIGLSGDILYKLASIYNIHRDRKEIYKTEMNKKFSSEKEMREYFLRVRNENWIKKYGSLDNLWKERQGKIEDANVKNIPFKSSHNEYIQEVFDWCREVEFPYPKYNHNILNNSYNSLLKSDISNFSMNARYGMKIINHFHPSIWKANRDGYISPYEAWQKDDLLIRCIKNRIIYKGCNLDRSKVLAGFSINKIAPKVSLFNPNLAKYIVGKYLSKYNIVFDPCSGYSGRMLGVCSLGKKYIGQDINPETVKESNNIIKYFNLNASIECKDLLNDSGEYECLFTCPPYGNKEIWNQEIKNKSCDEWIDEILNRYKCKEYLFIVDKTEKYKDYVVEEFVNKSHFNSNSEYLIKII